MTVQELLELSIADIEVLKIHPIHKAMLEECCETALANEEGITDSKTLVHAVRIAFLTCNSMLKGTLKAAMANADVVNLNYRGVYIELDKNSPLITN